MSSEEYGGQLSGNTVFTDSYEISLGEEQSIAQESDGLKDDLARMDEESGGSDAETGGRGEEASNSGQAAGIDLSAYTHGAGKGSDVSQAEIDWMYRPRSIPEEVFCRITSKDLEPAPEPGEIVVFAAHFERGFATFLTSTNFNPTTFQLTLSFIFLPSFLLWKVLLVSFLPSKPLLASITSESTRSRIISFRTPNPLFSAGRA
jgi:hypothetical protein